MLDPTPVDQDEGAASKPEAAATPSTARPFFVGIGSSAGGLEALTTLVPGLPSGLGLRYVVVQHMSPTHRSMMAQLLGRTTQMPVLEITDGCMPMADTVYVTPPNSNVILHEDGSLRLLEPPNETVPKPSVNLFFESMAESVADRAIGVVLSGTGSDGAIGLHAIKAAGGFSFAQEPGGAKYEGMVRSAIEAGGVDWVLPAEAIGAEIARIVQRQQTTEGLGTPVIDVPPATLQALLHNLYAQTRIDFTGYKEATLLRRIERRMTSTGCLTLDQYVEHTRLQPTELQALSQDMLISVTSFFRDRVAFDRLREEIVRMLESKPAREDIRVWVAGCASGEEAYSMAIVLHDALQGQKTPRRVQIFASDIDEAALGRARRAVYPASLLGELDPTTLERHFVRHADGYEVSKALRSLVMFARHNLVQDPPFVRVDLVSCRNVMIYLQAPLQDRLLKTFYYALNAQGLLFLGRSEGVHNSESNFELVDRSAHLFRRVKGVQRMPAIPAEREIAVGRTRGPAPTVDDLVLRATAVRFAPASVLVDAAGDVRHLKGDLQGLMTLPDGRPVLQLMALLRRELRPELARLIRTVREALAQSGHGPRVTTDGHLRAPLLAIGRWRTNRAISLSNAIRLSVQPLNDGSEAPMLLVCFERRPLAELPTPAAAEGEESGTNGTTALEEELATTREHLYTVIEELETSNEEAHSLNEEIQTANEELQSTNEELEASNEELQASNEELTTVNEELQVKSQEWQTLNNELEGIYSTVDFPLLAFDERGVLTRTNSAVPRQFGMDSSWIGRHISALPWPTGMPSLLSEIEQVQACGRSATRQLTDVGNRDWVLRIMPRVRTDGVAAGVLVLMEDNTQLRQSQWAAARSDAQLRQLVERSAQLVCICDPAGRLQMANPEFERCHLLPPGSAAGKILLELLPAPAGTSFREAQLEAMRRLAPVEREETLLVHGGPRILLASYYPLFDTDGGVSGVCYQALDITHRKHTEAALLSATSAQLAAEGMARTKSSFLANMSHEIRTPMNAVLGLSRMVLQGELPADARQQLSKVHEAAQALTRILDDVLDFSKIEAGALRFEERAFALDQVLSGVRSLFSANAQEKNLLLTVEEPLGVPDLLVGDPFRLSQVLNNLVSNALKFTTQGQIRISVMPFQASGADAAPPGWCQLRFSVRDTGAGLAPGVRETLFQAFTQGDASVTRRFGGTGLGLAICQRLVEMMQGRIGVNSAPGQGSEFWFTVKLQRGNAELATEPAKTPTPAPALAEGAAPTAALHPAPSTDAPQPVGLRLLLADDNELNQIVSRAVLERMGHEVTVVADGAEAVATLEAAPAGHFSAVLMDLHMPVMDGLEATRRIRILPQGADLPILALTAAAFPEDRVNCLAAGMDDHITKPLEPELLSAALRNLTQGHADKTAVAEPTPAPSSPARPNGQMLKWPALPSFDLQPLFDRLHHNEPLMWSLLETFSAQEADTGQTLTELLQGQQTANARLRTHTLMGAAAAVGATRVAQA
ncbi:CheR family methyltransferase, partial [Ideonella sp.]|uniref:CheR family methyltransferase n=1 Tax=Ideonella sp. TaxID=1929293 RepID=UPI003BB55DC9